MSEWTSDVLERIAAAEELHLVRVRRDATLGKPMTIWVVRHGHDLYARSWRGRTATWFRGVQDRHEGQRPVSPTIEAIGSVGALSSLIELLSP
jgi:hypothetical protein